MFIFYKIFNIDEETVKWKDLDGLMFHSNYEYIVMDVYESPNDMDINDLLCDYTYNEDLISMSFGNPDVKSRLDELIRIDKIKKLLN